MRRRSQLAGKGDEEAASCGSFHCLHIRGSRLGNRAWEELHDEWETFSDEHWEMAGGIKPVTCKRDFAEIFKYEISCSGIGVLFERETEREGGA